LRHNPGVIGIKLDKHGWADAQELIAGINKAGSQINMDILEEIVRTDKKGRYSFNNDKTKIRANQGHSISVDVGLEEKEPPEILYHGTAGRFLPGIWKEGLKPMGRLYVHLSIDAETAEIVGKRHGKPAILKVHSGEMYRHGIKFYLSENNVWLVKKVESKYLEEF
ncbi:MAG: RNA 2'-phosphotransferase, partial [Lachnospiraceae bacterium]|nr:RNA 2'-phosphotransferase [Lachnospiraceae bacterium]